MGGEPPMYFVLENIHTPLMLPPLCKFQFLFILFFNLTVYTVSFNFKLRYYKCKSNVLFLIAFILYLQMLLYGRVFGSHEVNEFAIFIHPDLEEIECQNKNITVNLN